MKKLTRKEMIEAIVNDQIKRGIVEEEDRAFMINMRLKGFGGCKRMSEMDCRRAYEAIFA